MDAEVLANKENWYGSCYELAISAPSTDSAEWLAAAAQSLWETTVLEGPIGGPYAESGHALECVVPPAPTSFSEGLSLYGVIHLPNGQFVGCRILFGIARWLILCIPTGMLDLHYKLDYPLFPERNSSWMQEVNRVMVDIAQAVYTRAPFNFAVLGEEAGAIYPGEDEVTTEVLDGHGAYLISPRLFERLRPTSRWEILSSGLLWRDDL